MSYDHDSASVQHTSCPLCGFYSSGRIFGTFTSDRYHEMVCSVSWLLTLTYISRVHDDVIKWKHFPYYWPFVRGIHRSSVNSPYKGQWRKVLMFSLFCAWINGWVNNCEAGDLRRNRANYDVALMDLAMTKWCKGVVTLYRLQSWISCVSFLHKWSLSRICVVCKMVLNVTGLS